MLRNLLGLNSTSREARLNATLYASSENLRCKVGAGEVLDYSNSYLGDDKLAAIVEKARLANAPTRLDLRGNCFEAGAARALAMLIRSPYNVVAISLEWNNIGLLDQGVEALAGALEVDKPLLILDLRNNNIGQEGAKALAKALRVNRTLRQLDLRWNKVRNPGVFAFREALQSNHSLVTLELMGNNTSFDEIGIEHLSRDHRPLQSMRRAKMMMRLDPTTDAPALPPDDQLLLLVPMEKEELETELDLGKRERRKMVERTEELEMQLQQSCKDAEVAEEERDRSPRSR